MFNTSFCEKSRLAKAVYISVRTATKRASSGHGQNNNTAGRRLGRKCGDGEFVKPGQIIWRQRGTNWYPGENCGIGRDHTIYAKEPGYVRYYRDPFHAKRKFIGVALEVGERLPSPHLAPRRRRFGLSPILDPELLEEERTYLRKKELESTLVNEIKQGVEAENRSSRESSFAAIISASCPELAEKENAEKLQVQADRYCRMYSFLQGGFTAARARQIVDEHDAEDFAVALRIGRLTQEEYDMITLEQNKFNELVDKAVVFGPRHHLLPTSSFQDIEKLCESAIAELDALCAEVEPSKGTPEKLITQIEEIIARPIFTTSQAQSLLEKYVLPPSPIQVSEANRDELQKLAAEGHGKIQRVWLDAERNTAEHYFPPNAAMVYP